MIQTTGGNNTNLVSRIAYGQFPVNTGDWTLFFYFRSHGTPTTYMDFILLSAGVADFAHPYVWCGSDSGSDNAFVEVTNDGLSFHDTTKHTISDTNPHWVAITYNHTTHVFTFIIDGSTIGTTTCDMSTVTFDRFYVLGDASIGVSDVCSVAYSRAWSNILSSSELTAESLVTVAAKMTGLIWDCPFQAGVDLTSHNNTLNQLTATGIVTTDFTDPLISTIAGPPTNITPGTAMTVTTDSAIFVDTISSGSAVVDTWYKFTSASAYEYGAIAFGDLVTFKPEMQIYAGLSNANSNIPIPDYVPLQNGPIQWFGKASTDYYLRSTRNAAVSPAVVTISVLNGLNIAAPGVALFDNDDTTDFPLVIMDAFTGYPIKFIDPFPATESAGKLGDGTLLVNDPTNNASNIYNEALILQEAVALPIAADVASPSGNNTNTFIVGSEGVGLNHGIIRLISSAGVLNPTIFDLGSAGLTAVTITSDNTKAYYVLSLAVNTPIKTWDLVNNVPLADFLPGVSGIRVSKNGLMTLSDGTILAIQQQAGSPFAFTVKRYNTSGTLLNTYTYSQPSNSPDDRLAVAPDNPNSFWVWLKLKTGSSDNGFSKFINTKVSDGSIIAQTPDIPQFEDGVYATSVDTNTPYRFGHSESCPFWVSGVAIPPGNPRSGLYFLSGTGETTRIFVDRLWIDAGAGTTEDVGIPNPFAESYLIGDE